MINMINLNAAQTKQKRRCLCIIKIHLRHGVNKTERSKSCNNGTMKTINVGQQMSIIAPSKSITGSVRKSQSTGGLRHQREERDISLRNAHFALGGFWFQR